MPIAPQAIDELLDPISADQPAGEDLRWKPEWDRIKEARRADDGLDSGKWAKRDSKSADWRLVKELATAMLLKRSKDLQLAMWLTEANIRLEGFAGLRDGLRISRELMARYWDKGLYPQIDEGPEDRGGPLEWLNNKLVDSIVEIPITVRSDEGQNYSIVDLREARRVGSEAGYKTPDGEIDDKKKKAYDANVAAGKVSKEHFERAVRETRRAAYEEFNSVFLQCHEEFKALEKVIDEKFGDVAPNMAALRSALNEMKQEISDIMDAKREQEADFHPATPAGSENPAERADSVVVRFPLSLPTMQGSQPIGSSWNEAEMLIRSGQVDKGLAEMIRLAANETSGRNRFQRKLMLAEVCLASNRERLARSILEELAEQIDKFQLELWEASDLVCGVWTRLYKLYKKAEGDADRAQKLYQRLCRLDPWQALSCGEA